MCEDNAGYVDSQGYDCSIHIGNGCLNELLYTEELGYSSEDWKDIVESCPESCGLCKSSGETWSAVPQAFAVMIVLVYSPPSCFRWMSLDEHERSIVGHLCFCCFRVGDIEAPATSICSESCAYSKDGYCNDGGSGGHNNACAIGTDCAVGFPSKNDLSK
jgi:hypothetical protein